LQDASHFFAPAPLPPQGLYEKTTAWISRNRTTLVAVLVFSGTTAYLVHRKKKAHSRKRRAKKLPNGTKKEIVILACPTFHDPLTRSLAVDLERRGYVVYVTVSSTEEDSLVQQEAKADLRPLWMDLTSTVPNPAVDIHPNLEPIRELLANATTRSSPAASRVGSGSSMSSLSLAGIVVFPGCSGYPEGSLALLPPSDVVDTINTRLVAPVITVQQFLPLLARHSTEPKSPASIVIAYPSIPKSLSPPRQIPEAVVTSSLSALASSLRREVTSMSTNITVHEMKLGNFDLGSLPGAKNNAQTFEPSSSTGRLDPTNSALTHWHSSQRAAIQRTSFGQRSLIKGSAARELHNAVFDALAPPQVFKAFGKYEWQTSKRSSTVFVGSGARVYDFVGGWVPSGIVGFVMGFRNRNAPKDEFLRYTEQSARSPGAGVHESVYGGASAGSESAMWEKI
jgi:NAD(P)-dependent dehydrogenase (short-subunit alcohol dehydrogenase family)